MKLPIVIITVLAIALTSSCHSDRSHELLGHHHGHSRSEGKHDHEHNHDHDHDHDHDHEPKHSHTNHQDHQLYGVIDVAFTPFGEVIRAGGEIMPARGDEQVVIANHDGLVLFALAGIQEGIEVKSNQQLITISSGNLVHDNLEAGYLEAKAQFEKAKIDFQRASRLMADTIIPEREYLDAKLAFEVSQAAFNAIKRNYEAGGQKVLATTNGYIKRIHVVEGEFVQMGQPLVTISQNKRLVIKVDVPQNAIPKLQNIRWANFITPYDGKIHSTTELNGRLVSWGRTTADNSFYIPVFFEVDNKGDLIPGTFVEVYLQTAAVAQSIAIPKTALLEEFGSFYVFIDNHEGWEKRYVTPDGTDGKLVRIAHGLNVGEHVATRNVSRIRLSQMSGQLPEHAHVH